MRASVRSQSRQQKPRCGEQARPQHRPRDCASGGTQELGRERRQSVPTPLYRGHRDERKYGGRQTPGQPIRTEADRSCRVGFPSRPRAATGPSRIPAAEGHAEKEAEDEVSGLDEGSIMHRILYLFLTRCRDKGFLPLKGGPKEDRLLGLVSEEVWAEAEKTRPLGRRPLWRARRGAMSRNLKRWLEQEQTKGD